MSDEENEDEKLVGAGILSKPDFASDSDVMFELEELSGDDVPSIDETTPAKIHATAITLRQIAAEIDDGKIPACFMVCVTEDGKVVVAVRCTDKESYLTLLGGIEDQKQKLRVKTGRSYSFSEAYEDDEL